MKDLQDLQCKYDFVWKVEAMLAQQSPYHSGFDTMFLAWLLQLRSRFSRASQYIYLPISQQFQNFLSSI